jgi:hypothetical protein
MKKLILASIALTCAAGAAFGQGAIAWGNNPGSFRAPIYGVDPGSPAASVSGQSALGTPTGATAYGGLLLQGTGFTFAIYTGGSSATSNQLTLLASTTFRTGTATGLPRGLVNGGTVTVPGADVNTSAHYQIRVWDNAGGTLLDWASALASSTALGYTPVLSSAPLGGSLSDGSIINTPSDTFTSFSLYSVPEPASFALAGLGAAAMLIFRRRNSK